MKYRHYLCKVLLLLLLFSTNSCKKQDIRKLIAGDDYKIWDCQDTIKDGKAEVIGCYYFSTNGDFNFRRYNKDKKTFQKTLVCGSTRQPQWSIINSKNIELNGTLYKVIKLNEDTLHLSCKENFSLNLFLVKSKNQTRIEGYDEKEQ